VKKSKSALRSVGLGLAILLALVTYAYGFKVTKVNLEETKSERRQTQLIRILRALAKPDIVEFDKEQVKIEIPFYVPCPEGGFEPEVVDKTLAHFEPEAYCADPGTKMKFQGTNFEPNVKGPINFLPPSGVTLGMGIFETDENGNFEITVTIPRRPETEIQYIETVTSKNVGEPRFTRTAIETWDKIIETVFLALLATTLGTLLAVPLSFFAARNLMKDVTSPIIVVALNLIAIPIGIVLGGTGATWMRDLSNLLAVNGWVILLSIIVGSGIAYGLFKWAVPPEELEPPTSKTRFIRSLTLVLTALVGVFVLFMVSKLMIIIGTSASGNLGGFGFLGSFFADLGDILGMIMVIVTALLGAGVLSGISGKAGNLILKKFTTPTLKILGIVLGGIAGALWFLIIMGGIDWIYQINQPLIVRTIPAILGAVTGAILGAVYKIKSPVPIGMAVYLISRTIFNVLRSIEALVMAIVFVVWVGIGPFAGSLALALHTIASLAKLYSEQVESIMAGPIEAVSATGANRLQTIIYAVVPQIIPPYISFTMYRWDINVRMSTIIGFAGGGGIGFLLQQNINLLNYRAASVQMLAIAIVVASMDYISSKLREKIV
jgi:phosphonate ABC transporter permease subunit PhnE